MEQEIRMTSKQNIKEFQQSNNLKKDQLESQIFTVLGINNYIKNNIPIENDQHLYSIFIQSKSLNQENIRTFYIGHGFGGSSMLFLPYFNLLLSKGNIVIWQIRGMGLNNKKEKNQFEQIDTIEKIEDYFLKGMTTLLNFYNHKKIVMFCHSFSAYLAVMHSIKIGKPHIGNLVLLSPVGITPEQNDHNNSIKSFSDLGHTILSKFGWFFKLSYKSVLRTICYCTKASLTQKAFQDTQFALEEKALLKRVILTMVDLPDGSETLFFNYFQPKVIPKEPIQPIFKLNLNSKIKMFFGGATDWADREGAYQLAKEYPESIEVFQLQEGGHNIPMFKRQMEKVIHEISQS